MTASRRIPVPFTYMITSGEANPQNYPRQKLVILSEIERNTASGVSMIQVREKELSTRQVLELARAAVAITRGSSTRLLVNERFDVAIAAGADGVHLTSTSIPASVVREQMGAESLIGVSCHNESEIGEAAKAGADFAVFGPVFSSPAKGEPVGLGELSRICKLYPDLPVAALGGIDAENCSSALEAGASGVAGIRVFSNEVTAAAVIKLLSSSS